jgi:hypothetical protein
MVKINLLPPEILAGRQRRKVRAKLLNVAVFVAILLVAGFGAQFYLTMQVNAQVKATEENRLAVEQEVARYAPVVELQGRVNKKRNLLGEAMGTPLAWRDTLGALGIHIPSNVWLTNVALVQNEDTGMVTLRGLTYDHPSTANWVDKLQRIPGVSDVRVQFSAEETVERLELVRFEIRASVTAGEEYDPLRKED